MEVHHHSHPVSGGARKKWTHYFWEFLMLFLAVFCGFLAEYQLEHKIEKDREKQFIFSMVKELEADYAQSEQVLKDSVRIDSMNALINILYAGRFDEAAMRRVYYISRKFLSSGYFMTFSNNTLTQLKSGGNMRLIRKRNVVDSLNRLDNFINNTIEQEKGVFQFTLRVIDLRQKLINSNYFRSNGRYMGPGFVLLSPVSPEFMSKNKEMIIEYANSIGDLTGAVKVYFNWVASHRYYSGILIPFLKKEYNLK
jgi:hypothetical protein